MLTLDVKRCFSRFCRQFILTPSEPYHTFWRVTREICEKVCLTPFIIAPADDLALVGIRASAGSVLTKLRSTGPALEWLSNYYLIAKQCPGLVVGFTWANGPLLLLIIRECFCHHGFDKNTRKQMMVGFNCLLTYPVICKGWLLLCHVEIHMVSRKMIDQFKMSLGFISRTYM